MKVVRTILKNFLVFISGGVLGAAVCLLFLRPLLQAGIKKDVGLGIIAVAPVITIFYLLLFFAGGGIAGILFYNVYRIFYKKRRD